MFSILGSHLVLLSLRLQVFHPSTRINVGLLGPCYKTGLMKTFSLRVYSDIYKATTSQHETSSEFGEIDP
jgi:hypothetical protein